MSDLSFREKEKLIQEIEFFIYKGDEFYNYF
jgi:hypothetical protein